jgi:hypothetical protein
VIEKVDRDRPRGLIYGDPRNENELRILVENLEDFWGNLPLLRRY